MSEPIKNSELWSDLEPFALRLINGMLNKGKSGKGAPQDPYAIILYKATSQVLKLYSMTDAGLNAALAAAVAGDTIFIPPGTITGIGGGYIAGDEISNGAITVNSAGGNEITGLTPGTLYAVEVYNGPWYPYTPPDPFEDYQFSASLDRIDWSGSCGMAGGVISLVAPSFSEHLQIINTYYARMFFTAYQTNIYIRAADASGAFGNNTGTLSWRLRDATFTAAVIIPDGVEVVGLAKNTILDCGVQNDGILTNIQVTGGIVGTGQVRLVANPNVELFSNQIESLIAGGLAPFIVASQTVNINLNADMVDGEHAQKSNLDATTAPTVNDDFADGYEVGSRWIDVTADKSYTCVDATVGAAVWIEGGGGSGVDISSDDADITAVNLDEQGSDPAAPGAGNRIIYAKSDGIYERSSAGTVTGPLGALADTAVTPGSYTNTNLTVDQKGRITAASSGSAVSGEILIQDGSSAPPIMLTNEAEDDFLYEG